MTKLSCPLCEMDDIAEHETLLECMVCGHEWERELEATEVKDAYGNVLEDGDIVQMIKDKKLTGTSKVLKSGMKSKGIRLHPDSDHPISCKMDGLSIGLKPQFVKKVVKA